MSGKRFPKVILPKAVDPRTIKRLEDTRPLIQTKIRHVNDLQKEIQLNSRCFDVHSIQTYTRIETLECRIPVIRGPTREDIIYNNSNAAPMMCNVFQQRYMPGYNTLLRWRCQLEEHQKRAPNDQIYVCTEHGLYGLIEVGHMLALHKAASTRMNVDRELEWFAHSDTYPGTVKIHPPLSSIRKFQNLILCTKWDMMLEDYGMGASELATVCCDRWLSAGHMKWIIHHLNQIQTGTLCVYNPTASNVENLVMDRSVLPEGRPKPSCLLFICCVGKSDVNQITMGTETTPGYHYSLCHLDTISKRITYGDSLGWEVPNVLPKYLAAYHAAVYGSADINHFKWHFCHEPTTKCNHVCTLQCAIHYPLQTCLSICGPVVIVIATMACLRSDVFHHLTSVDEQADSKLAYLQMPSKYACYLRKVLAVWLAEQTIRLDYIIPLDINNSIQMRSLQCVSESDNIASDPEDDTSEIPAGNLDRTSGWIILNVDGSKIYKCPCCPRTAKSTSNLKRHFARIHVEQDVKILDKGNCLCVHCDRRYRRICDLRHHLQKCHATIFTSQQITFNSTPEFDSWKETIEESESCLFAQCSGQRHQGERRFKYLQCNRSGMRRKRGDGKRNTGTCKIDNNCTSSMKVTCQTDGKVDVEFHRTHYGHQKDLERLWLPQKKRDEIAAKLGQGVSRDHLLDEIRDCEGERMRQELARPQDASVLRKSLGIETVQKHLHEKDSVLAWIKQWETAEENPLLFCKLPGSRLDENLELLAEDYVIIMQTPFQKHMTQKFASRGVWWDSTHSGNVYDFHLMTLLALSEFGEGFPMAWCISNREEETIVRIFFTKVKENCGELKPCWFMADSSFKYFKLWTSVFPIGPKRFICPWHVDQAWKEELKNAISDMAVQAQVYRMLRVLLEHQDEISFQDSLQKLLGRLSVSPRTTAFRKYFIKEWIPKMHEWAYCYRTSHCLNPGVFSEAFHIVFQQMYHQGHVSRRVDSCLVHLLKYIRDKTINWMVKFPRVKVTMRLKIIHDRHLRSMLLSSNQVSHLEGRQCWEVCSDDGNDVYIVERLSITCPGKECRLRCEECDVCVHLFLCNCPDSLINSTICKHIHLIQRLVRPEIPIHHKEAALGMISVETEQLKQRLCSTLCQMTSMVETANDTNLETLRDLNNSISTSYQLLNQSLLQETESVLDQQVRNNKRVDVEPLNTQIKKTKF